MTQWFFHTPADNQRHGPLDEAAAQDFARRTPGALAWREPRHRAAPDALNALEAWVARYRTFWPERVEALKGVLKEMDE